ncbi:ATP-binding protein [Nitriliruptor alkaliphilus]|uniref:ATP-binding protein n=1 Tax=Nitriliruptor alkaliphilus TaxID=427918 RepID=UPI0006990A89|nr:ATP-binding protein [Nitriliruptor alkaliphilus]
MIATVRSEVAAALQAAGVADPGDLPLAAGEVVVNALEHGRPPVEVRVQVVGGAVEVIVRDAGAGPARPVDVPGGEVERGRGRWLAHHLATCEERRTPDGFEVRLTPGPGPEGPAG